MSKLKAAAPFVLFTVFLDVLSIGIIIPVLPKLVERFAGTVSDAGLWLGLFGALWGLAQFIFSPIQGGLSDRYGRRPVILLSNLGLGISYVLMALSPNLWWLLVARIISGATSASIATAYAYMADVTPPEKRAGVYGLLGAAFGVGFVIGPSLGAFLGAIDLHWPFIVTAVLSGLNFLYGFFVLPESLPKDKRKPFNIRAANPLGSLSFLAKAKVMRLAVMSVLISFAHNSLPIVFVLYAGHRFGWGLVEVGLAMGGSGILSAIVQAGLTGRIVKRIGEKKTAILGFACGAIGFTAYGIAPTWQIMIIFMPFLSLWGLANPAVQSLMSAQVSPSEQGTLQGANMSVVSMATIIAPLIFGAVLAAVTHEGVPMWMSGIPFVLAGLCLMVGVWLALGVKTVIKRDPPLEDQTPTP